jgi:hypothetical protein
MSCHPVYAAPEPNGKAVITQKSCLVADKFVSDTIRMMQGGSSNIEIMSYLDKESSDPKKHPAEYMGAVLAKLNVPSVRVALKKAYKPAAIIQKQSSNCLEAMNTNYVIYE